MAIKMTPTRVRPSALAQMKSRAATFNFCLFRTRPKGQGGPVFAAFDKGAKFIRFAPTVIENFGRTLHESPDPFEPKEWDDDDTVQQCRTSLGLGFRVVRTGQELWLHRADIHRWTRGGDFPKLKEKPPLASTAAPARAEEDQSTLHNALAAEVREIMQEIEDDADKLVGEIPPTPPDSILDATVWLDDQDHINFRIAYIKAPLDDFG